MISGRFLSDDENIADLVTRMQDEDQKRYNSFGHLRIEAVFLDRKFLVYRPDGLTQSNQHRPPQILTTVTVTDITATAKSGAFITLVDEQYKQELRVTYVPRKLWNYPIYVSVPPRSTLRWDARKMPDGKIWRSMSFAMLIKTQNRSDFYSKGNFYMEVPNRFKELYPNVTGQFAF